MSYIERNCSPRPEMNTMKSSAIEVKTMREKKLTVSKHYRRKILHTHICSANSHQSLEGKQINAFAKSPLCKYRALNFALLTMTSFRSFFPLDLLFSERAREHFANNHDGIFVFRFCLPCEFVAIKSYVTVTVSNWAKPHRLFGQPTKKKCSPFLPHTHIQCAIQLYSLKMKFRTKEA